MQEYCCHIGEAKVWVKYENWLVERNRNRFNSEEIRLVLMRDEFSEGFLELNAKSCARLFYAMILVGTRGRRRADVVAGVDKIGFGATKRKILDWIRNTSAKGVIHVFP